MARSSTSFKKGITGNAGSRPKGVGAIRNLAKNYSNEVIHLLMEIARDENERAPCRIAATEIILNRGWGKPSQKSYFIDIDTTPPEKLTTLLHARTITIKVFNK